MLIRGILKTLIDGAVRLFSAEGRPGETFSKREFLQHYGFASAPKEEAELLIYVSGNVITAIGSDDRRYRLELADGEAALYDWQGQKVHLKAGKEIEISGCDVLTATANTSATLTAPTVTIVASDHVELQTPTVHCTGDFTADGDVKADGDVSDSVRSMAGDRTIYNGHKHLQNGYVTLEQM
jgi:phage baseplate assembly protein V